MGDSDAISSSVAPEIAAYYGGGAELGRLFQGRSQLERARTESLLARYLPPPPATVLDIGGGPGVYARWLAERGYQVHLIDPVPLHVEEARHAAVESGHSLASASIGDARRLEQDKSSADAVLLMGPLYHLTERDDRLRALREAARVLRPGGVLVAVAISRFASLCDGLLSGFLGDPGAVEIVARDLATGQHRNLARQPDYFTTAYFHRPEELPVEIDEAGLAVTDLVSIEGPSWWMVPDFEARWQDPSWREQLLAASAAVEREPSLLGLGPHLMAAARAAADPQETYSQSEATIGANRDRSADAGGLLEPADHDRQ